MRLFARKSSLGILPLCIVAMLALQNRAQADTIQDNYGVVVVNFLNGNPMTGTIPGFDSALGTLSSIELTYDSGATLVQGNAISSRITITDSLGTQLATINFSNMTGRAQQAQMGGFAVPLVDFSAFENAGNVPLTFTPFTACRGQAQTPSGCSEFTASVSGTVAYTFTPSSPTPTPEPQSLALVCTGLTGIALVARRGINHLRLPD